MDERPSPAADLVWSLAWIAFGTAVVYGSWTMDRLEKMNINPYTVPGLVPGLLGGGIVLMGALLLFRSIGEFKNSSKNKSSPNTGRLALATALCLAYGAGLVGHGVPFWAATFLFVFVSIALFQSSERRARGETGRGLAVAAACALVTAAGVTLVFQELFLVRLP